MNIYIAINHHGLNDEHFYVAEAYRFSQGANFIVNDWHIAQLMGFITAPLISLYQFIFKTTDGIVLFFRITYILLSLITSLLIAKTFRNESKYNMLLSLLYFSFVPFNINSLSYNTMSVNFLMLSVCIFINRNKLLNIVSGVTFSLAVLCTPYLAIVYLLFLLYFIFCFLTHNNHDYIESFKYSFIGIMIIFIIFIIRIFPSNMDLFLSNLTFVLNDPSHSQSIVVGILKSCYQAYQSLGVFGVLCGMCAFLNLFIRKKTFLYISMVFAILSVLYFLIFSKTNINIGGYSVINISLVLCGLACVSLIKERKLIIFFMVFLIHGFIMMITSNVGIRTVGNVWINAAIISLIFLSKLDDLNIEILLPYGLLTLIGLYCLIRLNYYYLEPTNYNEHISVGPLKYLASDLDFNLEYNQYVEDFNYIDTLKEDVYLLTDQFWAILSFDESRIINYSIYEYMYESKDTIRYMNQFLLLNNYDSFLVYEGYNKFNVTVNDIDNSFKKVFIEQLNNGKLYKVSKSNGN